MKSLPIFFLVALLGVTIIAAPVQSETTVVQTAEFQPLRDATLIESTTGDLASSTAETIFVGRTGQAENGKRRGLIAFDLAAIPARSRILSVTLTMTVQISAGGPQPTPISLYRVLSSWGEGSSASQGGRGVQAQPGDPTWIYSVSPTHCWSRPGGDYERVVSGQEQVGGPGAYTWKSTPGLVTDVQSWLNSPKDNFGWILVGDESRPVTAKVFKSRESTDEAARPKLTVTFRPPAK
ncbi:MAG: DNRLRE domain-containing protein [Pyrinomonadaceae bacterium]|nr:DNRLRE domain-containing protein [Pyrinomonadaceae bacterium]